MVEVFRPFDYGRFEFRVDFATGEVRLPEVNLNCNLWSEKVFGRAAVAAGFPQADLIETTLAASITRQCPAAALKCAAPRRARSRSPPPPAPARARRPRRPPRLPTTI